MITSSVLSHLFPQTLPSVSKSTPSNEKNKGTQHKTNPPLSIPIPVGHLHHTGHSPKASDYGLHIYQATLTSVSETPPPHNDQKESPKTETNEDPNLRLLSKVLSILIEVPSAVYLINYRFFKQTGIGETSSYTPKPLDYFKGIEIVGPARILNFGMAFLAKDIGMSLTSKFFPESTSDVKQLIGGACSAVVGGCSAVPIENVMIQSMNAIRANTVFDVKKALLTMPSPAALTMTLSREMPYFLAVASGPDLIMPVLPNTLPEDYKKPLAIVTTATTVSLVTQPADVIKTRVQQNNSTIRQAVTEIATNGTKAFFTGALPRLAKVYTNFFVTWVIADKIYGGLQKFFK